MRNHSFAQGRQKARSAAYFAGLLAGVSFLALSGQASAESFEIGNVDVNVDSTVSLGVSLRASDRDCEMVNVVNGGCRTANGSTQSVNSDDANLNFDQWDFTSITAKATHDISASWQNFGAFARVKYFYDHVYAQNDMRHRKLNHDARQRLNNGIDLLDAFVYTDFAVDDVFVTLRAGKQALNWGESLFIPGGINAFQAVDVAALRTPGSELKEAFLPMPMLSAQLAFPNNLSMEAFWQFDHVETELDPAGSFYATTDIAGPGSLPALSAAQVDDLSAFAGAGAFPPNPLLPIALPRGEDQGRNDTNQYGLALRYYAEDVNQGTEFGLYYTHYTSRLPFLTFRNGPQNFAQTCTALFGSPTCLNNPTAIQGAFSYGANQGTYFYQFPDSIETFGTSFSTLFDGTAVAGELAFTPRMPLATTDQQQNASQTDGQGATPFLTGGGATTTSRLDPVGPGQATQAIVYEETLTGQINTIDSFATSHWLPQFIGSDNATFLTNVGFMYVPDAEDHPLNRSGSLRGIENPFGAALFANGVTEVQYGTAFSAGYRLVVAADYNNAFGLPVTLSPNVAWRHDVTGYSPGPIGPGFVSGLKAVTLGLNASYQSAWRASLGYTNSFGGGFRNALNDRDFVSASISYAF